MKNVVVLLMLMALGVPSYGQSPPNIIWLMAEDISTDLETYGTAGVETPHLNKLAGEGVKYTNVFSTNPICSPNRSAMMVGAHQNVIGAQHHRSNRNRVLPDPYKPLTYWLRKAGYTNILGHHGVRGHGRKIDVNFKHERLGPYDGETSFGLFDKLDTLSVADQPFFAQIQLNVTHRGDWWKQIRRQSPDPVDPDSIELPPYMADHPVIRQDWARYLDQVEYMDREVGLIMKELEDMGIAGNTVVIFLGDNGRANVRGKGYLYDPGLRVPLIVRWPNGLPGGQVSKQVVSTTDIAASTLQLAGVNLPDYLTGVPFIGTESSREAVFSARDLWDEVMERSRSVSTRQYKYIRHEMPWVPYDAGQAYLEFYRPALHIMRSLHRQDRLDSLQASFLSGSKPQEELYDLQNDPHETNNLIDNPACQDELSRLRNMLEEWEAGLPESDPDDHNFVSPGAPELLQWVKYQRTPLYLEMLKGEEIGFGRLNRKYRSLN
ncbi:sulfatase family protein [Fodinibius sediminis]|nr:sulfatase [Fodinibius sediminis]